VCVESCFRPVERAAKVQPADDGVVCNSNVIRATETVTVCMIVFGRNLVSLSREAEVRVNKCSAARVCSIPYGATPPTGR
jgi:hypothetical protein